MCEHLTSIAYLIYASCNALLVNTGAHLASTHWFTLLIYTAAYNPGVHEGLISD